LKPNHKTNKHKIFINKYFKYKNTICVIFMICLKGQSIWLHMETKHIEKG